MWRRTFERLSEQAFEAEMLADQAFIFWRKRRLRLAEAAAHRHGLASTLSPYRETVKAALVQRSLVSCEFLRSCIEFSNTWRRDRLQRRDSAIRMTLQTNPQSY